MKGIQIIGVTLILVLMLLPACAPKAAPAPVPQALAVPAPAPALAAPVAPAKPAWQAEWEKTEEAAKKEGKVVVLISTGQEVRRALTEAFKQRFGVSIEWLVGTGSELGVRIVSERRAAIYSAGTGLMGHSVPMEVLKPTGALESLDKVLFLPELTNPQEIARVWRFGILDWLDNDHTGLAFAPYVNIPIHINTQLVKPGEIKSYRDLLNPKWKGKIIIYDVTLGQGISWVQAVGAHIMGWDYLGKLAQQEPILTRDGRLQIDWLAHGKYAIAIAARPEIAKEFEDIGAPVQPVLPEEGGFTVAGTGVTILLKDAPHPNAAKLFINWLLSRDGQLIYCKAQGVASGRTDAPIEGLNPLMIPNPKIRYIRSYGEEALQERPEATKKTKEIFTPLKK